MSGALVAQIRVIAALTLRESRMTFGTSHAGYLWAVIQPLLSISVLVAIFYVIGRQSPYGTSLALFFASGVLTLELFNRLSGTLLRAYVANRQLLYYPAIRETDALFARFMLVVLTYLVIFALFFGGLVVLGLAEMPRAPDMMVGAFAATALLGLGVGSLHAMMMRVTPIWAHVETVIGRPLFFLSGVFYIPSQMPPEVVAVLRWNPVLHVIEWMREGYYPHYDSDVFDPFYPLAIALVLLALGLGSERMTRRWRAA